MIQTRRWTARRIEMLAKATAVAPLHLLFAFGCLLNSGNALAQRPPGVTPGELSLLPEYCVDTQGFGYGDQYTSHMSPRGPYWVGLMGLSFWHHHHYCWGLLKMRRALLPGVRPEQRTGGLVDAYGDFDYVVRNATPDFVMLPEIFLKMGDTQVELGSISLALELYAESARRKPDYWPAYVSAAAALEKLGMKKDALGRIAAGLVQAPDDPVLQKNYKRLGGDLAAFQRSAAARAAAAPPAAAPASAPARAPASAASSSSASAASSTTK